MDNENLILFNNINIRDIHGLKQVKLFNGDIDNSYDYYIENINRIDVGVNNLLVQSNSVYGSFGGSNGSFISSNVSLGIVEINELKEQRNYYYSRLVEILESRVDFISELVFEHVIIKLHGGKLHSLDTAAITHSNGNNMYYIDNNHLEYDEWLVEVRRLKIVKLLKKMETEN